MSYVVILMSFQTIIYSINYGICDELNTYFLNVGRKHAEELPQGNVNPYVLNILSNPFQIALCFDLSIQMKYTI